MSDEPWFFGHLAAIEHSARLAGLTGLRHRATMTGGRGPNGEKWKVVPADAVRPPRSDWPDEECGLDVKGQSVRSSHPAWLCTTR